jgi:hypothetical protein
MRTFPALVLTILVCLAGIARAEGPVSFKVSVDPKVRPAPASGRLIVMLKRVDAKLPRRSEPIDGPFWDDPQPLFGTDVRDLPAGTVVVVDDAADAFPMKPSELEPGAYYAQARLDVSRRTSSWRTEEGNLYSEPVLFGIEKDKPAEVALTLTKAATPRRMGDHPRVEIVEVESKLLSEFYGVATKIRAAVVKPVGMTEGAKYAAIYHVPGYGGSIEGAIAHARQGDNPVEGTATGILFRGCFHITLDPESPNGHTLFADSANNGPRGEALVKELIPAIEARFPLVAKPEARLLRGHSSGGWSTIWLAITYPEVFGAAWSSAPDPVDFRKLQTINIYEDANAYRGPGAEKDWCSYRKFGKELMTVRQENGAEEVIGPDNTSAQQWDSWFAVFGPRGPKGRPAALFDHATGEIDRAVALAYRSHDIGELLRSNPDKYGPIFRRSIRLYVGDQDNFYLNEAVKLLAEDLERVYPADKVPEQERFGCIRMVQGVDHASIYQSQELRAIPQEMIEHLRRASLLK